MKKLLNYIAIAGLALSVSACSSNEAPETDMDTTEVSLSAEIAGIEPGTQADLEARAGNIVYFGYDNHGLTPDATKTLKRQAAWLKMYPNVNIVIEGNCDERGTRKYNQALGEKRANAAKRYLIAQGVPAKRITTVSMVKIDQQFLVIQKKLMLKIVAM